MEALAVIEKYYIKGSLQYKILLTHSKQVAKKSLVLARLHPELNLDLNFIEEAALLHDIGIFRVNAPIIECHGSYAYICHGYLGAELLRKEGYPKHALVAERHTGTGLSLQTIKEQALPLPNTDMCPVTTEEKLICFSDLFFSKTHLGEEKSIEQVEASLSKWGEASLSLFKNWSKLFL